jgi:hypothetical protein
MTTLSTHGYKIKVYLIIYPPCLATLDAPPYSRLNRGQGGAGGGSGFNLFLQHYAALCITINMKWWGAVRRIIC